jgi:hypothetical protein
MSRYKSVYTEVEVEVDLTDFDTEDLLEELEDRGKLPVGESFACKALVEQIWMKRRQGNHDYQRELDQLIYQVIGLAV